MSSSEADVGKIKRQIVMRYPFTFYEEISRTLIIFKSFRGNKKYMRALPAMDELIDYCNIDPISGKHLYQLTEEEKKAVTYELIDLPQDVVKEFKRLYHGHEYLGPDYAPELDTDPYDEVIGLKHLSPGTSIDARRPVVVIKKPLRFSRAYGDFPSAWTAFIAGLSYKLTDTGPNGFPITSYRPMFNWEDPDDQEYLYTYDIPYVVWSTLFEIAWEAIAPVCTRIERIIARRLTEKGFAEATLTPLQQEAVEANDDNDELDLS
jgi:hypothetical protein